MPALCLVADVVAVVVFAAIGRASHDESGAVAGVLLTAAPFLAGLAVAWTTPWVRSRPPSLRAGAVALAGTAVIGLGLRAAFLDRLPPTFVAVAVVSLGVLLLGWRGVAAAVATLSVRRAERTRR